MARDFSTLDNASLESLSLNDGAGAPDRGAARAELERRRREYEAKRDQQRIDHEWKLAELDGRYRANQMNHETEVAAKQMAHAEKLAAEQTSAAKASARATTAAAWAAGLSAVGALVSAGAAVIALMRH